MALLVLATGAIALPVFNLPSVSATSLADVFFSTPRNQRSHPVSGALGAEVLYDSFTDGDFTINPVWGGNTTLFTVQANSDVAAGATGSQTVRLNGPAASQTDYLSSQIPSWGTSQEWGFWWGRRAQAATAANQQFVWLYANESNLNSATVDGYRVQMGDDSGNDEIRLQYIENGAVSATVITSSGTIANAITDFGFLVRVTRDGSGNWQLFSSTLPAATGTGAVATAVPDSTNANVSQGTGTHNTLAINANGYLGLAALHSTGVNAIVGAEWDQFYFTPTTVLLVSIHDIQGAAHISPLSAQAVTTSGIVTAKSSNGFYMQDPAPDADDATSEGIFVFTNVVPTANVGDAVSVTGTVTEFRAGGGSSTNLTITEITSPVISINSTGNPLPAPIVIGTGGRVPPTMVIDDDATGDVETSGSFDHSTDGIDFYESLEGMRVQVNNPVAVDLRNPFGELPVLGDNGAAASLRTVRGGIVVQATDFNPERIILDDQLVAGATPVVNVSDGFSGSAVGVMDYTFGNFKLQLTEALTAVPSGLAPESTAAQTLNQLAVANFNMENLDPGDVARFPLFASQIVNNLQSPDILVVEEIQDNNGPTNDSTVDASVTFNTLISAIITAGGPTYSFRQIDPVDDQDGGEPGGNIRIGFLFRTDRGLAFVDRPGATSTAATSVIDNGGVPELSFSPGRIDPTNTAFNATRKSLAGEFTFNGHRIYVIGNHFVSRGGDQPLFGRFQPPAMTSDVQRTQQAQIINNFVDSILAVDANAKVIVAGDFNDFEFSAPVNTLEGGVLNNLTESLPANERYNFIFEGNSQALAHILLSNGAFARFADYDIVHFVSEFATQTSDQDPQVARLLLYAGPTAAPVAISGRVVDHDGRGISGAILVIEGGGLEQPRIARTSPFGYYSFEDLAIGTYTVTVQSRRYIFAVPSRTFSIRDNITDLDFVAEPLE